MAYARKREALRIFGLPAETVFTDDQRAVVRRALREFWLSPPTLIVIGSILLALGLIVAALFQIQRSDFQEHNDASLEKAVRDIRGEIQALKARDRQATETQRQMRREVNELQKAVEP